MLGRVAAGRFATALLLLLILSVPGLAAAQPSPASISLRASPAQPVSSHRVILSGTVTNAQAPTSVSLYADPYPFAGPRLLATTATAADGSFQSRSSPTATPDTGPS